MCASAINGILPWQQLMSIAIHHPALQVHLRAREGEAPTHLIVALAIVVSQQPKLNQILFLLQIQIVQKYLKC